MHVSVSVQESTAITLCDCTAVFKAKSEHLHAIMLTNVCKHDVCFFFTVLMLTMLKCFIQNQKHQHACDATR